MSLRRPWRILLLASAGLALIVGVTGISRLPYFNVSGANVSAPMESARRPRRDFATK